MFIHAVVRDSLHPPYSLAITTTGEWKLSVLLRLIFPWTHALKWRLIPSNSVPPHPLPLGVQQTSHDCVILALNSLVLDHEECVTVIFQFFNHFLPAIKCDLVGVPRLNVQTGCLLSFHPRNHWRFYCKFFGQSDFRLEPNPLGSISDWENLFGL